MHDDLVYVLNARAGGSVQGYGILFNHLFPIPGSSRALGLNPTATPEFVNTPGQVAFSPDGSQLIVTTKANGSSIDVFGVHRLGTLDRTPVVNAEPGAVPFAVTFDGAGNLVVTEAMTNAVATFALHHDGTLTPLPSVSPAQMATCWIVGANGQFYASNAGSASVTRVQSGSGGGLTLLGNTTTDPGSVDATATAERPLPLRTDRWQWHRGRVPDQRRRLAHADRERHRPERNRRRGHRRDLTAHRAIVRLRRERTRRSRTCSR